MGLTQNLPGFLTGNFLGGYLHPHFGNASVYSSAELHHVEKARTECLASSIELQYSLRRYYIAYLTKQT